jgi:hypothetical protein
MINVYRKYLSEIIVGKMKTIFAKIMAKLWQKSPKIEKGFNPFRAKPLILFGGPYWNRTNNLLIKSQVLCLVELTAHKLLGEWISYQL